MNNQPDTLYKAIKLLIHLTPILTHAPWVGLIVLSFFLFVQVWSPSPTFWEGRPSTMLNHQSHVKPHHTQLWPPTRFLGQTLVVPEKLAIYARAVHEHGAILNNCWGFMDGTVRPICRPTQHQGVMYNGHKRVHAVKYQSVTCANGLIAHLFGPVEGRRHDCYLLRESGLLQQLEEHSVDEDGNTLCIYGDPAYPLRPHLQCPFKGNQLTEVQNHFNQSMSAVRVTVEWSFGDIINNFKSIDFKKNQKVCLSNVGRMYKVAGIFTNAHTCLYGNATSRFFGLIPPSLEEYFLVKFLISLSVHRALLLYVLYTIKTRSTYMKISNSQCSPVNHHYVIHYQYQYH